MRSITAMRRVDAPRAKVFEFLSDLENHWRLSPRFEVMDLERNSSGAAIGGIIRVHGPLRLRRTVRAKVVHVDPPTAMRGQAAVDGTRADVAWLLTADGDGTVVQLSVTVVKETWRDHLLFALGGKRWLQQQFRSILDELNVHLS